MIAVITPDPLLPQDNVAGAASAHASSQIAKYESGYGPGESIMDLFKQSPMYPMILRLPDPRDQRDQIPILEDRRFLPI